MEWKAHENFTAFALKWHMAMVLIKKKKSDSPPVAMETKPTERGASIKYFQC